MPLRWVAAIAFIFLILFTVPLLHVVIDREAPELATFHSLALPGERELHIRGRLLRDRTQAYYYQITDADDEPLFDDAFFGSHPPGAELLAFEVHVVADGRLVAVTATIAPEAVLILHDFDTDEAWPAKVGPYEPAEPWLDRGERLIERFNSARDAASQPPLNLYRGDGMRPLPMAE